MKKIFTLIAVCAMALTANAQGKYAMEEGEEVAYGTQPAKDKRVTNCKMYFGDPDATGDLKDFSAAEADNHVDGYTAYTKGNNVNGNKEAGTVYVFQPAIAGNITVAVVLNADKAFHISEDGTDMAGYEGIKVDEKYYGTYTFDVKAGSTYKVWCDGSKLGFYGFEFKEGSSAGINTVKSASENGVRYNLSGQKVAEGYKGVVIMNGRKMIQK
jgi:hypothetical protein